MDGAYLGEIRMFAGSFAPRDWFMCDGSLISVNQYTALFSLLGTTYGGDGANTFGLPDMRGRLPIGYGQGSGLSPRNFGDKGGSEKVQLTTNDLPAHAHGLQAPVVTVTPAAGGSADLYAVAGNADIGTAAAGCALATVNSGGREGEPYPTFSSSGTPDTKLNAASVKNLQVPAPAVSVNIGAATAPVGNGGAHDNMSPYLCVCFIICYNGIYPSRP